MNCLIKSEYIIRKKKKQKSRPIHSRMNCLIESECIIRKKEAKIQTHIFPNELPS